MARGRQLFRSRKIPALNYRDMSSNSISATYQLHGFRTNIHIKYKCDEISFANYDMNVLVSDEYMT